MRILKDLRDRYSGERRNPFNEIECGDHYARAMAGWSVIDALSGVRYDASGSALEILPAPARDQGLRLPFVGANGWGTLWQRARDGRFDLELDVRYGTVPVRSLTVAGVRGMPALAIAGTPVAIERSQDATGTLLIPGSVEIEAGSSLRLSIAE
jgi:hypothetical protein